MQILHHSPIKLQKYQQQEYLRNYYALLHSENKVVKLLDIKLSSASSKPSQIKCVVRF